MPLEVHEGVEHHAGTLSMARSSDPGSGTSSFSVLLGEAPHLNGEYPRPADADLEGHTFFRSAFAGEGMARIDRQPQPPARSLTSPSARPFPRARAAAARPPDIPCPAVAVHLLHVFSPQNAYVRVPDPGSKPRPCWHPRGRRAGQYTVFGKVTGEMTALRKMEALETRQARPCTRSQSRIVVRVASGSHADGEVGLTNRTRLFASQEGIFVMPLERVTIHSSFIFWILDPAATVEVAAQRSMFDRPLEPSGSLPLPSKAQACARDACQCISGKRQRCRRHRAIHRSQVPCAQQCRDLFAQVSSSIYRSAQSR